MHREMALKIEVRGVQTADLKYKVRTLWHPGMQKVFRYDKLSSTLPDSTTKRLPSLRGTEGRYITHPQNVSQG